MAMGHGDPRYLPPEVLSFPLSSLTTPFTGANFTTWAFLAFPFPVGRGKIGY